MEKFSSLVLPKNVIKLQHLIIQFKLYLGAFVWDIPE